LARSPTYVPRQAMTSLTYASELALRREPDAPGVGVMREDGFGSGGVFRLDAGPRILAHKHNGEELRGDQPDECHKAEKILHDHPPFAGRPFGVPVAGTGDY